MLWILSGSYHSGKNTFKNILARQYGFKVIDKYVLADAQENYFTLGSEQRARRDPYLVVSAMENIKEALSAKKSGAADVMNPGAFIYDKKLPDGSNFYCIIKDDLKKATGDEKSNYLLVCSDPDTINDIKTYITQVGEGNSSNNIKTVLIYGLHYDAANKSEDDRKKIEEKTKDKAATFLKHFVTAGFDYVLCNKHYPEPADRENNLIAQWESLTQSLPCHPYRLCVDSDQVQSGIFFAKPFPKEDSASNDELERAKIVLNQIQTIIKRSFNRNTINIEYNGRNGNYYIGGESPAQTVRYQKEQDIPIQMRKGIEQAKLVIVDVADKIGDNYVHNPNCWWELGYARALNKQVIVLFDKYAGNIPFDESANYVHKYTLEEGNFSLFKDCHEGSSFEKVIKDHFEQIEFAANNRLWHIKLIDASNRS